MYLLYFFITARVYTSGIANPAHHWTGEFADIKCKTCFFGNFTAFLFKWPRAKVELVSLEALLSFYEENNISKEEITLAQSGYKVMMVSIGFH